MELTKTDLGKYRFDAGGYTVEMDDPGAAEGRGFDIYEDGKSVGAGSILIDGDMRFFSPPGQRDNTPGDHGGS